MRAFGCSDQLNHLLRAAEPVLNLVRVAAQRFHSQLRRYARFGEACVFGDEANLVDLDPRARILTKILFEALAQRRGLGPRLHEGLDEVHKLVALDPGREADAGDSGGVEELSKAALGVG